MMEKVNKNWFDEEESGDKEPYSEEEEEKKVKERLKELGYPD